MANNLAEFFSIMGVLTFFFFLARQLVEWKRVKYNYNLAIKMLDKWSGTAEMPHIFNGKGQKGIFNFLTAAELSPKQKIITAINRGIIILTAAIGVLFVALLFVEESRGFYAISIIIMAIGAGYLLSSFSSYFLGKKWGIIEDDQSE